jgi:hypothetical protein
MGEAERASRMHGRRAAEFRPAGLDGSDVGTTCPWDYTDEHPDPARSVRCRRLRRGVAALDFEWHDICFPHGMPMRQDGTFEDEPVQVA